MAAGHGGKRVGAGRPNGSKKAKAAPSGPAKTYESVLAYLCAVALGTEPGDPLRVAAAKAALPYEAPKRRVPVQSPAPERLRRQQSSAEQSTAKDEWAKKSAEVRRRIAAKKGTPT